MQGTLKAIFITYDTETKMILIDGALVVGMFHRFDLSRYYLNRANLCSMRPGLYLPGDSWCARAYLAVCILGTVERSREQQTLCSTCVG